MVTLITGGSGFLGRGIMTYLSDSGNGFVVYSRDEYKQDLCRLKFPYATYVLGDVKDYGRLCDTLIRYNVDDIIHTAAIKYIPEAEVNVLECVDVNIQGSINVARAAIACGVNRVVGISTDKAAQPVNVYGSTKMLMERIFQEYSQITTTQFMLTRYGNVVGSTGSVIPTFQRQLKESGKVKLTDPDMTRFWISIRQAVDLVGLALNSTPNGCMIVPKASAMTMLDLAITIAGSNYEIVGVRPGEKKHEQMIHTYESVRATDIGNYYIIGNKIVSEPFVLSSNNPQVWIDQDTMRSYISMANV